MKPDEVVEAASGKEDKAEEMTFEEAYGKLETVVRRLEAGEVRLEEALALFEQGIALTRLCTTLLDRAEAKMQMLVAGEDGQPELQALGNLGSGAVS